MPSSQLTGHQSQCVKICGVCVIVLVVYLYGLPQTYH